MSSAKATYQVHVCGASLRQLDSITKSSLDPAARSAYCRKFNELIKSCHAPNWGKSGWADIPTIFFNEKYFPTPGTIGVSESKLFAGSRSKRKDIVREALGHCFSSLKGDGVNWAAVEKEERWLCLGKVKDKDVLVAFPFIEKPDNMPEPDFPDPSLLADIGLEHHLPSCQASPADAKGHTTLLKIRIYDGHIFGKSQVKLSATAWRFIFPNQPLPPCLERNGAAPVAARANRPEKKIKVLNWVEQCHDELKERDGGLVMMTADERNHLANSWLQKARDAGLLDLANGDCTNPDLRTCTREDTICLLQSAQQQQQNVLSPPPQTPAVDSAVAGPSRSPGLTVEEKLRDAMLSELPNRSSMEERAMRAARALVEAHAKEKGEFHSLLCSMRT